MGVASIFTEFTTRRPRHGCTRCAVRRGLVPLGTAPPARRSCRPPAAKGQQRTGQMRSQWWQKHRAVTLRGDNVRVRTTTSCRRPSVRNIRNARDRGASVFTVWHVLVHTFTTIHKQRDTHSLSLPTALATFSTPLHTSHQLPLRRDRALRAHTPPPLPRTHLFMYGRRSTQQSLGVG